MAAGVVPDDGPYVLRELVKDRQDVLNRAVVVLGSLERRVRLVHVGLMVLVVVQVHRLLVDVRLERVVAVRQRRDLIGHG